MPFSHRNAGRTEKFFIGNKEVFIGLDTIGLDLEYQSCG